jgi:hypothetical protein
MFILLCGIQRGMARVDQQAVLAHWAGVETKPHHRNGEVRAVV